MTWHVSLTNIAGIRQGQAELSSGINAIRASNWQGKSSFLAGIETLLGTSTPLTEGESHGRAELETPDDTYQVELYRENGQVVRSGSPLLSDEHSRVCAELFAVLDETNPVRRAVRNGENLEDVLTRPLNFENIDERIADLRREREQIDTELTRAESAAERLPELESTVTSLESKLEELRKQRDEFDDTESGEQDDTRERLSEAQADRDRLERRIDRLEQTLQRSRERRSELQEELDELDVNDSDELEEELSTAQAGLRDYERDLEVLQAIYEANKQVLDEDRLELLTDVTHSLSEDAMTCWICGNEATREEIEMTLAELGERVQSLREKAESRRERVEELQSRLNTLEDQQRRKRGLESDIRELKETLTDKEAQLETARDRRRELEAEIDELETIVEAEADERTELESEIKYTEAELDDVTNELEEVTQRASKRPQLKQERDEITEELTALRERKETIKRETREAFEHSMRNLIDEFELGFEVARLTSSFELVIARDGRETSIDALSEGEIELVGLMAALAGHEAFEVKEQVPVLLLDGLGSIASDNLTRFIERISDKVPFLVVTTYPEYESISGREIDPTQWTVVSRELHAEND